MRRNMDNAETRFSELHSLSSRQRSNDNGFQFLDFVALMSLEQWRWLTIRDSMIPTTQAVRRTFHPSFPAWAFVVILTRMRNENRRLRSETKYVFESWRIAARRCIQGKLLIASVSVTFSVATISTKRFARRKNRSSTLEDYGDRVNHRLTGITFVSCRARAWNTSTTRNNRSIKLAGYPFRSMNRSTRGNVPWQCLRSWFWHPRRFLHVIDNFTSSMTALCQLL